MKHLIITILISTLTLLVVNNSVFAQPTEADLPSDPVQRAGLETIVVKNVAKHHLAKQDKSRIVKKITATLGKAASEVTAANLSVFLNLCEDTKAAIKAKDISQIDTILDSVQSKIK